MVEIDQEMTTTMTSTNRLLCQEMLSRGWRVRVPYWYVSQFFVERNDGKRLHLFSSSPPSMSFAAARLSDDKLATSRVLEDAGVKQLPLMLIDDGSVESVRQFMADHAPIIIKPLDGSHGNGITANVTTEQQLVEAINIAQQSAKSGKVLAQKQLLGDDLKDVRVLVIDGRYIGAVYRVPARVFGDGTQSVRQLIEQENQQPWRGERYKAKLAHIDLEAVQVYLGDILEQVPAVGEEVRVLGIANYGAGGELIDVTDDIPEWMQCQAEKIAAVLELPVAGIDYMIDGDISAVVDGPNASAVIEVNKSPALCMHDEPTEGSNRQAVRAYVDYLATL